VIAVYFDVVPGDARSKWEPLLHDPRVESLWDRKIALGRKLAESPEWTEPFDFVWDAWLLYGPDARWSRQPPAPLASGGPVEDRIEELRAALRPLGVLPAE
jgi:hypothetical protein